MTKQEKANVTKIMTWGVNHIKECDLTTARKLYAEIVTNGQFACNVGMLTLEEYRGYLKTATANLEKVESASKK